MKIRVIKVVSLLMVITVLFSGCSLLDFFSAENLLRAPKLTGENSALQQTFEAAVGKDVSLFTPIAGEHRASYIFFDANGDNVDEVIVFYALNSNLSVVHMHLLSRNSDSWYSVADIIGSGTGVYKVDFFNIDTDANLEIAVSWSADDSQKEKKLSIYKISGFNENDENSIVSVATMQIADYINYDLDSDGIDELLYFYYGNDNGNPAFSARLIDYDLKTKTLLPLSDISLNRNISGILKININEHDSGFALMVDSLLNDGHYYTEIIYFNNELSVLSKPELSDEDVIISTVRTVYQLCDDFNNDGLVDIPIELEYEDSYSIGITDASQERVMYVSWITFYPEEVKVHGMYFENTVDGYRMKIDKLYEHYYFVYDYNSEVVKVCLKNSDDEDGIVFTVECENDNVTDSDNVRDYLEFDITVTPKGKAMNISEIFVKDLISY